MTWSKLEITQVGVCPAVWTMLENHLHLCKWSESGKLESFCMNWNIDGNKNSFKLICFLVLGFQVFKANPLDPWQLSAQQPWLQVDGSWEGPLRAAAILCGMTFWQLTQRSRSSSCPEFCSCMIGHSNAVEGQHHAASSWQNGPMNWKGCVWLPSSKIKWGCPLTKMGTDYLMMTSCRRSRSALLMGEPGLFLYLEQSSGLISWKMQPINSKIDVETRCLSQPFLSSKGLHEWADINLVGEGTAVPSTFHWDLDS